MKMKALKLSFIHHYLDEIETQLEYIIYQRIHINNIFGVQNPEISKLRISPHFLTGIMQGCATHKTLQ